MLFSSEVSYGFDVLVLPKDEEGFAVEVPPSPEVQDELGMEADMSEEEEGSMPLKSQTSYGMMTYPLPKEGGSFLCKLNSSSWVRA